MPDDVITHDLVVEAGQAEAFEAFTAHLGAWWPIAYTFSEATFIDAKVEPRVGGRWFERNDLGEESSWGEVRAFVPGERLVLAFGIGPDRKPVPDESASEVEVRFSPAGSGRTRVALEHRAFDRHGEGAESLRAGLASPQGWPLILAEFARWLRVRPDSPHRTAGAAQPSPSPS